MRYRILLLSLYCFIVSSDTVAQKSPYPRLTIEKEPAGKFEFNKNWAYRWDVVKDRNGKFSSAEVEKVTAKDTTHLYFTADCKTNVQGGYKIRYCYATKKPGSVVLSFTDGAPAYASEYKVIVKEDHFTFDPVIVYPELILGQKLTYNITRAKLILYQKDYSAAKMISGYVDAEFTETIIDKGVSKTNKLYFRGYFKTQVKAN